MEEQRWRLHLGTEVGFVLRISFLFFSFAKKKETEIDISEKESKNKIVDALSLFFIL